MNKKIKKLWIEALRSKMYRQGMNALRIKNDKDELSHCCLGVLCEIAIKEADSETRVQAEDSLVKEQSFLPDRVVRWALLDAYDPVVEYNYTGINSAEIKRESLAYLNDRAISFDRIATLIDRNL